MKAMSETSGRLNEATPKFTDRVTTSSLPSDSPVGKCAELLGNRTTETKKTTE